MKYASILLLLLLLTDWAAVHFAFTTSDDSGVYHATGTLENGRLSGTTHSLGRDFLAVWTAERIAPEFPERYPWLSQ